MKKSEIDVFCRTGENGPELADKSKEGFMKERRRKLQSVLLTAAAVLALNTSVSGASSGSTTLKLRDYAQETEASSEEDWPEYETEALSEDWPEYETEALSEDWPEYETEASSEDWTERETEALSEDWTEALSEEESEPEQETEAAEGTSNLRLLSKLWERQMDRAGRNENVPLIVDALGLDDILYKAMREGLTVDTDWGVTEETGRILNMQDILEEGYVRSSLALDQTMKAWSVDASAGIGEQELLQVSLYGDREQLALSIPQLYDRAVALRSGNFMEQFQESALARLLFGTDDLENRPMPPWVDLLGALNLQFYPGESAGGQDGFLEQELESLEQSGERFVQKLQVEKSAEENDIIFTVTCRTEDAVGLYVSVLDSYFNLLRRYSPVMEREMDSLYYETVSELYEAEQFLGDEITLQYTVEPRRGLIKKITGIFEVMDSEEEEPEYGESYVLGTVSFALTFAEPENPFGTYDLELTAAELEEDESEEALYLWLTKETKRTETREETTVTMMAREDGTVVYWGIPFACTFDSESMELDMTFGIEGEDEVRLDSAFVNVLSGESFDFQIDGLTLTERGKRAIGLKGQVSVKAGACTPNAPEEETFLLEASQGELYLLAMDVSSGAEQLSQNTEQLLREQERKRLWREHSLDMEKESEPDTEEAGSEWSLQEEESEEVYHYH